MAMLLNTSKNGAFYGRMGWLKIQKYSRNKGENYGIV